MRTIWYCEHCHASGADPSDGSVQDVVARLEQAHDRHELAMETNCIFSTTKIRVQARPEPSVRIDIKRYAEIITRAANAPAPAPARKALPKPKKK
jgi:hypothetical protein